MAFLILLFRIFYLILLSYTIVSLIGIFLVHLFRKLTPVHTHKWAFAVSMLTKVIEGALGFYILSQAVAFFMLDLQAVAMDTWQKYVLGAIFLFIWVMHVELHKGREEGFLQLEGANYMKYGFDLYYIQLMKISLVTQVFGSLGYVFYLSYYPASLQAFSHAYFKMLMFF
ncbi:MAG: hypothetical protein EAZ95_19460 [Bacteroidetes bacterium]|nr:MAG: hypothetical protein EAZ95_19460 [Bacteroidota bacterium]